MNTGMLWFDNSRRALDDKLTDVAAYYRSKYNREPNVCFVHPVDAAAETRLAGIVVKQNRSVLPNHFWIGIDPNIVTPECECDGVGDACAACRSRNTSDELPFEK